MAPYGDLFARDDGCGYGYFFDGIRCRRKSGWYFWGRWVLAGIAIVLALILLTSCLCISRRNRRRGAPPMYGTGWFSGAGSGRPGGNNKTNTAHEMNNYPSGYNQVGSGPPQPPYGEGYMGYTSPPPYGQPPVDSQMTGTTFNAHDGYMVGQPQQYGVQQPQSAYQPGGNYQPPAGPPPGK
ncbi:hypothetical protein Trco_005666 [Trichoderma cornu-damae]|uniref:Chitin synthesis regulation, Congo red resistance, RCR protein n=1 Tax=Trichoderma cornu-damae TaxID=654480 RepID=A0A9P8QNW0_9HYPO|nr:hypothetical protein Trco_005666 [Trichoderma cornu-damae]